MTFHAIGLALFAVLLAWPVPMLIARMDWPSRAPGVALVLWQAIAIAGGLSMVGAPLCLGLAPFGDSLPLALWNGTKAGLDAAPVSLPIVSFLSLILAAVIAGYLLAHLASTVLRVIAQRRHHLELLRLLSAPHPTRKRTRVLDDPRHVAYCLPTSAGSLTILSRGLLDDLSEKELSAVVAHEEAHLRQRHDIVLVAFRAWHQALPWFPVAALAERQVAVLVEMLADNRARRLTDDHTVARAIVAVAERGLLTGEQKPQAGATLPEERTIEHDPEPLHERVMRLLHPRQLAFPARALVVTIAVALVAVPTLLLLLPAPF